MSQHHYTQLSQKQRVQLEGFLKLEVTPSQVEMARALGCHQSTISREIARNCSPNRNKTTRVNQSALAKLDGRHYRGSSVVEKIHISRIKQHERVLSFKRNQPHYTAKYAQRVHDQRMGAAGRAKSPPFLDRRGQEHIREFVERGLTSNWSPEQIYYRLIALNIMLAVVGLPPSLPIISHRVIYKYIKEHPEKNLTKYLRRKGRPYRYKNKQAVTTFNTTNREKHSIHDRPEAVNGLKTYGNGEGDTIFGADKKDRLLTHVERISGVGSISLVLGFDSGKITTATEHDIKRIFGEDIKTITYDNGVEFSGWRETERRLGATIYFADPYKSCQRGRNENFNGLVREYFPKGTDFKKLKKSDIMRVESLINNRPRKRFLGFTPLEVQVWLRFMQLGC